MNGPSVSIVLPVHNQADHIGAIVGGYAAELRAAAIAYELILVPNACRDDSPAICRELADRDSGVRVLTSAAGGWGLAVRLGLEQAAGKWLCYTNSARTDARDLVEVVRFAVERPATVVKANRLVRQGPARRLGSWLYGWECRAFFRFACADVNGTPKVFPREFSKLRALTRNDDVIDVEFLAACQREGYPVLEFPIARSRRHGGRSTTNWRSALRMYAGAYHLWKELRAEGAAK